MDEADGVSGDENADADAGLAQQALQPLMRARLPFGAGELVASVGVELGMEKDQRLGRQILGRLPPPQDRHVRHEHGVALGDRDVEIGRNLRPARCPGDEMRRPAEDRLEEGPGVAQDDVSVLLPRRVTGKPENAGGFLGVEGRLANRRQLALAQDVRPDDEPLRLQVVQPFGRIVDLSVKAHGSNIQKCQFVAGQR